MQHGRAEILREYGPFPGIDGVHGVTYDGARVWFASGDRVNALDPESGEIVGSIEVAADAGTAFDGTYLYQIAGSAIRQIDPRTGQVVNTIPTPGQGGDAGLAWAEGTLWVGQYRDRRILQIDPATGAVLRTVKTDRFVTGVTWVEGELWHGAWEGESSEVRRIDAETGEALVSLAMPPGSFVAGLESDGGERFFCGGGLGGPGSPTPGGPGGRLRVVRRPRGTTIRAAADRSAAAKNSG